MHLTGRLTIAAAAATLAGPLLSMPPSHAAAVPDVTCFSGNRTATQDGYHLSANLCDGQGLTVLIRFGSAAGTYRCRTAFVWNGFLGADGCRQQ
ncbi:hypothetical protein [Actinomadura decatromicini]|uniref:Uncharacterized protein n=1 Tax=Actinomadura decatromicini TaxID=2604572 RepID=A0A5D3FQ50_9ACTN|nr:hypothetical protein [Actinomadura decatromicini]TYK50947.1 hypothetical protein FXF68_10845 [Actinomadura decatromicini]